SRQNDVNRRSLAQDCTYPRGYHPGTARFGSYRYLDGAAVPWVTRAISIRWTRWTRARLPIRPLADFLFEAPDSRPRRFFDHYSYRPDFLLPGVYCWLAPWVIPPVRVGTLFFRRSPPVETQPYDRAP